MATVNDDGAGFSAREVGEGFDVGLHGRGALGEVEVGLALDGGTPAGDSLGVVLKAPKVGRIALGLAFSGDGTTRLTLLERHDETGAKQATLTLDSEAQTALERELEAAKAELAKATAALSAAGESEGAVARALGERIQGLETRLSTAEEARSAAERAVDQLQTELTRVRRDVAEHHERREAELAEAKASLETATTELSSAREAHTKAWEESEAETAEMSKALDEARAATAREQIEAQRYQRRVEELEAKLEAQTAERGDADAEHRRALEAAQREAADAKQGIERLEGELATARVALGATQTELSGARDEVVTASGERSRAERLDGELAVERARREATSAEIDQTKQELEEQRSAVAQLKAERDALQNELAAAQGQSAASADAERAQLRQERDEARTVARQLQSQAAKLLAERDEARNVARLLHQRTSSTTSPGLDENDPSLQELRATIDAERAIAAQLMSEKQRLQLQAEAASRQLDSERTARAKAAAERDAWRDKYLASQGGDARQTTPGLSSKDFSRQETKPYELGSLRQTDPNMTAVVPLHEGGDEPTQSEVEVPKRAVRTQPFGEASPSAPTKPGRK